MEAKVSVRFLVGIPRVLLVCRNDLVVIVKVDTVLGIELSGVVRYISSEFIFSFALKA